jgi:hypothetical protein
LTTSASTLLRAPSQPFATPQRTLARRTCLALDIVVVIEAGVLVVTVFQEKRR